MEGELGWPLLTSLVRVLVEGINPTGVERGGAPLDPMHLVALLQQQLRQIAAILPGVSDRAVFALSRQLVPHGLV